MSESEAVAAIRERCETTDYERNGNELDKIISEFLRTNGYDELAHAFDCVECWRA